MKRKKHLLISVLLSLVMLFSLIVPIATAEPESCTGPKVKPVAVGGNPKIGDKKIDPPESGSLQIDGCTLGYEVYGEGKKLSWSVSSPAAIVITQVIVKGGPGANIYSYPGGATEDCNLEAPLNRGGNIPRISHFSFSWDSTPSTPSEPPEIVTGSISGYKFEVGENGNGDTPGKDWTFYLYEEALEEGQIPGESTGDYFSATTGEDGKFTFMDLALGTYYLYEENKDGWEQVDEVERIITLTECSEDSNDNNFKNRKIEEPPEISTGKIIINKFVEVDAEKQQPDINFTVNVSNGDGYNVNHTVNPSNDPVEITDLALGTYTITETNIPEGYEHVSTNPSTVTLSDDANGGLTKTVTITNKEKAEDDNNGGGVDDEKATLKVYKFKDTNKNGTLDENEEKISGWKVFINDAEYSTPVEITVDAGSYTVEEEAKTDWEACTATSFSFDLGAGDTKTIYFGNCPIEKEEEYPTEEPGGSDTGGSSTPPAEPSITIVEPEVPEIETVTPPEEPEELEVVSPPEPPAQITEVQPELPRTGSNSLLFAGLGVLLSAAGVYLNRRKW